MSCPLKEELESELPPNCLAKLVNSEVDNTTLTNKEKVFVSAAIGLMDSMGFDNLSRKRITLELCNSFIDK